MDITCWLRSTLQAERSLVIKALEEHHDQILEEVTQKWQAALCRNGIQPLPGQVDPQSPQSGRSSGEFEGFGKEECDLDGLRAAGVGNDDPHLTRTISGATQAESNTLPTDSKGTSSQLLPKAATNATMSSRRQSVLLTAINRGGRASEKLTEALNRPIWHPGHFTGTTQFDVFFCIVILLNTILMGFELQYDGLQRGFDLTYPHFDAPARELWPHAETIFLVLDWIFGVVYVIEILVRIAGTKWAFFCDLSNLFDASLVLLWLCELTLSHYLYVDAALIRTLRLARVLRLLRLIRTIHGFDALYIMTTAMSGSLVVLFWSFVLLLVVQTTIAPSLTQILAGFFKNTDVPVAQRLEVFEYFGTASRSMFTMFELTLANWTIVGRSLSENVSEYFAIFNVGYKLVIGFAAVGIINAVFIQETFKVASSDDTVMMRQKERDRRLHTKKMKTLFEAADESGDGVIDMEEFRRIFDLPEIRTWLAAQDLQVTDPDVLFKLLDDGDKQLTAEELVRGVDRLKGNTKSVDLEAFIMEQRAFVSQVCAGLGLPAVSRISLVGQN